MWVVVTFHTVYCTGKCLGCWNLYKRDDSNCSYSFSRAIFSGAKFHPKPKVFEASKKRDTKGSRIFLIILTYNINFPHSPSAFGDSDSTAFFALQFSSEAHRSGPWGPRRGGLVTALHAWCELHPMNGWLAGRPSWAGWGWKLWVAQNPDKQLM